VNELFKTNSGVSASGLLRSMFRYDRGIVLYLGISPNQFPRPSSWRGHVHRLSAGSLEYKSLLGDVYDCIIDLLIMRFISLDSIVSSGGEEMKDSPKAAP
jgi:hypothetical protein